MQGPEPYDASRFPHGAMVSLMICVAVGSLGCSTFSQVSAGPNIGAERGEQAVGGGVSAHYGVGGHIHTDDEPLSSTQPFLPFGFDEMARVQVNNRFASFAVGQAAQIVGPNGFGRLGPLFLCNVRDPVLCGIGLRAELGFFIELGHSERIVPGVFVEERRRTKSLLTFSLFGEYSGYLSRRTQLPMAGVEVGYAVEDFLWDVSRGQVFR